MPEFNDPLAEANMALLAYSSAYGRCPGIEIEPGATSGCRYEDNDDCPTCAALRAADPSRCLSSRCDARHPQDEFDGAGCCPEEDGFLRAKARAAATPDPRVPSGLPIGYGGPTIKTDPLVLLAQVKAVVDERLDEREGCGPWRRDQFMRIDALLRDIARAASPDERLREAEALRLTRDEADTIIAAYFGDADACDAAHPIIQRLAATDAPPVSDEPKEKP